MEKKLFNKLNAQMEINHLKEDCKNISDVEREIIEEELIFGDLTKKITNNVELSKK